METITTESLKAIQVMLRGVDPDYREQAEKVLLALCATQHALGFQNGLNSVLSVG